MRRNRVEFRRVCQRVQNQIGDMPIRKSIENMVAIAASCDESFAAENAKPLRNGREFSLFGRRDLSDAKFSRFQQIEYP